MNFGGKPEPALWSAKSLLVCTSANVLEAPGTHCSSSVVGLSSGSEAQSIVNLMYTVGFDSMGLFQWFNYVYIFVTKPFATGLGRV